MANLSVGGESAQCDGFRVRVNAFELSQIPDVEQFPERQFAGLEQHHQIGAARDRPPYIGFVL